MSSNHEEKETERKNRVAGKKKTCLKKRQNYTSKKQKTKKNSKSDIELQLHGI